VGGTQRSTPRPSAPAYVISAVLLLAAFVALLWVPSYSHLTPSLYSLLWLVLNALCQLGAYQLMVAMPRRRAAEAKTGAGISNGVRA
jgi:protein-S-isoprenylcysteine O-methyltransferase Ste14